MRIWSIDWKLLHRVHLQALWREGLCGLKVMGTDKGYANHPQFKKFEEGHHPIHDAPGRIKLAKYLLSLSYFVKTKYGYNFNSERVFEKLSEEEMKLLKKSYARRNITIPIIDLQVFYELVLYYEKMLERQRKHGDAAEQIRRINFLLFNRKRSGIADSLINDSYFRVTNRYDKYTCWWEKEKPEILLMTKVIANLINKDFISISKFLFRFIREKKDSDIIKRLDIPLFTENTDVLKNLIITLDGQSFMLKDKSKGIISVRNIETDEEILDVYTGARDCYEQLLEALEVGVMEMSLTNI